MSDVSRPMIVLMIISMAMAMATTAMRPSAPHSVLSHGIVATVQAA